MADSERGHVGEADGGIRYVRFGGLDFTMDFAVQAIYVTIVFLLISAIWTYWTQDCFGYKDGNADRNIAVIILG